MYMHTHTHTRAYICLKQSRFKQERNGTFDKGINDSYIVLPTLYRNYLLYPIYLYIRGSIYKMSIT